MPRQHHHRLFIVSLALLGGAVALFEALPWSRTPVREPASWRDMVTNGTFGVLLLANLLPFIVLRNADIHLTVHTAPFVTFNLVYGAYWAAERLITLPLAVERTFPALAQIRIEWSRSLVPKTTSDKLVVCR